MRDATVSRTYAGTLLQLAERDSAVEAYGECLRLVTDLMEFNKRFSVFLETPRIDSSVKKQLIREVLGDTFPTRLLNFLMVVIDKRRQRLLPSIADAYAELIDEHFGRVQVRITTAVEPDSRLKEDLKRRLAEMLGREILPLYRTDERIVGGVIVRVGDRLMDGSVRRRLQRLRRELLRAEIAPARG